MKKSMIILMVMILVLSLSSCSKAKEPLRLGTMPTYSAAIYAVGIEQGFFEDANVEVELSVFRSARDRDAAATAGELDGFMTDIMGAINLNANNFNFLMTSSEYEVFGVMAGGELEEKSIADTRIGISENTVIEFIVDTYLDSQIKKVNIAGLPDRMGALLAGELDLGVFPNPFVGIIMGKGGQMTFDTSSEDFQPVVVVFSEDYLESDEGSIQAFYDGYAKTIEYMQRANYDDYKDALVVHGLATEENIDLFRLPVDQFGLNPVDKSTFTGIYNWMLSKGLIEEEIKFEYIYTGQFVK